MVLRQSSRTGLGATNFSITADGTRLTYTKEQRQSNLWFATLSGAHARFTTTQLTRGSAEKTPGRLSPDGRLVAFLQRESGGADVYVVPAEGGVPRAARRRHRNDGWVSRAGGWFSEGRYLAFLANHQGKNRVQTVAVEGGDERIYERTQAARMEIWRGHLTSAFFTRAQGSEITIDSTPRRRPRSR